MPKRLVKRFTAMAVVTGATAAMVASAVLALAPVPARAAPLSGSGRPPGGAAAADGRHYRVRVNARTAARELGHAGRLTLAVSRSDPAPQTGSRAARVTITSPGAAGPRGGGRA